MILIKAFLLGCFLFWRKKVAEMEKKSPITVDLAAYVDCVKTMQKIKFICERAQAFYVEEKDIEDILELLKGKV